MRALLTTLLLLAACATTPLVPVEPGPPAPDPEPAATSCQRAAARYVQLDCGPLTAEKFAETCEAYGGLGGSSAFGAGCMEHAPTCDALSDCRGGT
jgi:hypothetical protein